MTDQAPPSGNETPTPAAATPRRLKWLAVAGGVIVLVAVGLMPGQTVKTDALELTPSRANAGAPDSCMAKRQCVLVYIAPWCPACKSSVSAIMALRDRWKGEPDKGINVIIGADRPETLEAMAAQIGANTFVDPDGSVNDKIGVDGVPYWVVFEEGNRVVKRFAGGLSSPDAILHYLDIGS